MATTRASSLKPRPVRFMLNGDVIDVIPDEVDTTLLNWLRCERHLTGSKEGCAEGDCGACSVIISRFMADGVMRHEAANACILFLPMLDGLVITTIEHIAGPQGEFHPVQTAMVDNHGSQCGFCTPGFVVSLVAGWRQGMDWSRPNIEDLLAGNLCRCTGYGPIVAAAESLSSSSKPSWEKSRLRVEEDWLRSCAIERLDALSVGDERSFIAPETIEDLSRAISDNPSARIIAGATDIGLWVTKRHEVLPSFISVMRVGVLQDIVEDGDGFMIGCGVSHGIAKERLSGAFPQLGELWRRFGASQVRASGTVCGNLANGSPIGDLAPAFLALGASLVIMHGEDERVLSLDGFYHDYMTNDLKEGEWVKSVYLPKLKSGEHLMLHKISRRFDQDISSVMGAFFYRMDEGIIAEARVGFGGMAAVPARARATESALLGHAMNTSLDEATLERIADDFTPIDDVRGGADYRLKGAKALLARSVWTEGDASPVTLAGGGINDLNLDLEGIAE